VFHILTAPLRWLWTLVVVLPLRLVALTLRAALRTVWFSVRLAGRLGVVWPVRGGAAGVRRIGIRNLALVLLGVLIGLLLAPVTGRELRARLREVLERRSAPVDLADAVRRELATNPRTWHLPQPDVQVVAPGEVALRGEVPTESARADAVAVADAVAGVVLVDDLLRLAE
jgi:hypothetical protein